MFRFVRYKIKNKKWLNACLFTGVALLIAFLGIYPMFLQGSLDRLLRDMLEEKVTVENEYPLILSRQRSIPSEEYQTADDILESVAWFSNYWTKYLQLPVVENEMVIDMANGYIDPEYAADNKRMIIGYVDGMEEHSVVVDGSFPNEAKEGYFPCVITQRTRDIFGLVTGEHVALLIEEEGQEQTIYFEITGVIDEKEGDSIFWQRGQAELEKHLLVTKDTLRQIVSQYKVGDAYYTTAVMYDYTKLTKENAERTYFYLQEFNKNDMAFRDNVSKILTRYFAGKKSSEIMMFTFELPIICLLLLFLYMISGQILQMETGEIAMLKSRGLKKSQIVRLYALQSLLIACLALIPGIPLSFLFCKLAASTNSFLSFVAKDTHLYRFIWQVFPYAAVAIVLGVFFMTIPVISLAGFTIVNQKSKGKIQKDKPLWERYYLDLALLIVSSYLLYTYYGQREYLAQKLLDGETIDPVIFLNSSLFLLAGGLFVLRLIHLLVKGIYRLGKKRWKPAGYVAFLQIIRSTKKQGFISIFLVVTIGMGVFHSNLARSVNENTAERISYDCGTDLIIAEEWNLKTYSDSGSVEVRWQYEEPPADRFEALLDCGVTSMTKVFVDNNATLSMRNVAEKKQTVYGIETKKFGETASLASGINDSHWFHALNALAENPMGVIVSQNFAEKYNLAIGDHVSVQRFSPTNKRESFASVNLKIVAILKGFPGYTTPQYSRNADGVLLEKEQFVAIANLATLNAAFKIWPYEMWMRLSKDASVEEILEKAKEQGIKVKAVTDRQGEIQHELDGSMLQITNGMFSIGFIISLFLCGVGFLIYWILTIKERQLLYGIYRAMGMTMKEIVRMLFIEQTFSSFLAVIGGVLTGYVTTVLFTGIISIVYLPEKHNLPIKIYMELGDVGKIAGIVAVVFLICFFVIRRSIKRMNITKALKMGAD